MTKSKTYDDLVWDNFIIQKAKEIGFALAVSLGLTIIPYVLGLVIKLFGDIHITGQEIPYWMDTYGLGLFGTMLLIFICILIYHLGEAMLDWLEDNWKEAEEKAKIQMKEKK